MNTVNFASQVDQKETPRINKKRGSTAVTRPKNEQRALSLFKDFREYTLSDSKVKTLDKEDPISTAWTFNASQDIDPKPTLLHRKKID